MAVALAREFIVFDLGQVTAILINLCNIDCVKRSRRGNSSLSHPDLVYITPLQQWQTGLVLKSKSSSKQTNSLPKTYRENLISHKSVSHY